ncbi:MAG: membrane or secreted protein [bacterium]|nr:membrane or secreted protein [bacterium]
MKTLQKITLAIALITLFASCQSAKQILSKSDSRNEIIATIANDPDMSKEMMKAIMNSKNGKMMMQENEKMKMMMDNHGMMMKMMKDNPGMMKNMMSNMMEAAKSDTSMMSSMCKSMMGNQQMMDMMQKMKGKNMDMKKMDKKTENKDDTKPHH